MFASFRFLRAAKAANGKPTTKRLHTKSHARTTRRTVGHGAGYPGRYFRAGLKDWFRKVQEGE